MALTSPPAQKPRPAPVSTMQPTAGSVATRSRVSMARSMMSCDSAFSRSGRFIVSSAMPSRISTRRWQSRSWCRPPRDGCELPDRLRASSRSASSRWRVQLSSCSACGGAAVQDAQPGVAQMQFDLRAGAAQRPGQQRADQQPARHPHHQVSVQALMLPRSMSSRPLHALHEACCRLAAQRRLLHRTKWVEAQRVVGPAAQLAEVALLQQCTGLDGQRQRSGDRLGGEPVRAGRC